MPTKLDERAVRAATPPAKGTSTLWDPEIRGFGLRVYAPTRRHPEGAKAFFLNYRALGVERRLTIGEWPAWSALAARNEAKDLRRRVDRGEDPALERREISEAPTVADLAERYKAEHLPRKAPSSRKADWAMIVNEILPVLGERKVAGIHFGDMAALHRKITARGRRVRANRVVAVASKMFSLSLKPMAGEDAPWRDAAQGNPCRGIERNAELGRERFFATGEIARLTDALAEHENSGRRLPAAPHGDRRQARRNDARDLGRVRRRARLLDQAIAAHETAEGAPRSPEPGRDRTDRQAETPQKR